MIYTPPLDSPGDTSAATPHTQHFFLGHDNDIKSLAACPADITVAGARYPAHSVFASGQVSSHTHGPVICLWDSRAGAGTAGRELARLALPKGMRGVCALGFSPDGARLAAVAMDNAHTVHVYDWRAGRLLAQGRGCTGEPPQVCRQRYICTGCAVWCAYDCIKRLKVQTCPCSMVCEARLL